jgi:16S rRNA G1207 methylase RsmC
VSEEHYFSAEPAGAGERRPLQVRLDGEPVDLLTASGVFSADRLDPGTAVLLEEVPDPPAEGDLLDVGCGWGPIALAMARRSPAARVWAVDVNARAVALTAQNAARLGLPGVRAVTPEQVPGDVRFAAIWSNPPIRVGKAALHELLQRWLPLLADGGVAHLVVQKHLGADSLQRWLGEQGWDAQRLASARGYRVLAVRRP